MSCNWKYFALSGGPWYTFYMKKLSEAQCQAAMETGDFTGDLIEGKATAIILTQSWCPQWKAMQGFLPKAEEELPQAKIYYVEYDIEPWESLSAEDFMAFKENTLNNREIPYLRYYQNGVFSRDGNFISLDGFKSRLGLG